MTDINDQDGTEPSAPTDDILTAEPAGRGAGNPAPGHTASAVGGADPAAGGADIAVDGAAGAGTTSSGVGEPGPTEPAPSLADAPDLDAEVGLGPRLFHLTMLLRRAEGHGPHGGPGGPGPRHHLMGQGRVLTLLTMRSPIAQRELAYLLGIRPQSLGEILGKLESARLVTRTVDPADARARLVAITAAGTEAAEALVRAPRPDPLAPLTETERTQFLAYIDRVTTGLEDALGIDEDERGPLPLGGPDGPFPPRGGGGLRRGGKVRGRGTGPRPWGDETDGASALRKDDPDQQPRGRRHGGPGRHGGPRGPRGDWSEADDGGQVRRLRGRRRGCGRPGTEGCGPRW